MLKLLLIYSVIFASILASAQTIPPVPNILKNGGLERPPSQPQCNEVKQECRYLVVNNSVDNILRLLQTSVFKGNSVTASDDGYLSNDGPDVIIFGVTEKTGEGKRLYEELKVAIPSFDHFEIPSDKPWIRVYVKVFAITQAALQSFEFGLKGMSFGGDYGKEKTFTAGSPTSDVDMSLNMGLAQIKAAMRLGRSNSSITQIDQFERDILINELLDYRAYKQVFIAPTTVTERELKIGLQIGGRMTILSGERNDVSIEDFGLEYSTAGFDPRDGVNITSFNGKLILAPNVETAVIGAKKILIDSDKSVGLFGVKKRKGKEERHLMVSIKVIPMTYSEKMDKLRKQDPKQFAVEFNQAEVAALPATPTISVTEAFRNLEAYSESLTNGETLLGFRLDPKAASKQNLNDLIDIEIKGLNIPVKDTRTLQSLMVGQGYRVLKPIPVISEGSIKFKIILHSLKGGKKTEVPLIFEPYSGKVFPQ